MIIDIIDAKTLSPLEMNNIHFETGQHSDATDNRPNDSKITLA